MRLSMRRALFPLAFVLAVAACSKQEATPMPASLPLPAAGVASVKPAALDEATLRPVINHYSDIALAVFSDALVAFRLP